MEGILRTIHEETNVKWKRIFDGFVVSGTFEQIKRVGELLRCHLKMKKELKSERAPKDSRRPLVRDSTTIKQSMVGSKVSTETVSQSDCISRPAPTAENQFVLYETNKEKASRVGHLKAGVADDDTPPSPVSEIENTNANGERPEDQGDDQEQYQEDVKNLLKQREIPLESSEGKTDRPTQPKSKRMAGILDKNVSCEDEQYKSTLVDSSCNTEKATLISPVLNEASDQGNQPCSHMETPKSDE